MDTRLRVPLSLILLPCIIVGSTSTARAAEPDTAPSDPALDQDDAATPIESEDPSPEPAASEPSTSGEEPPSEPPAEAAEQPEPAGAEPPPPKFHDYDSPDLDRRDRYPSPTAATALSARDLRRARAGGLLVGLGLTAAVVAPVVVVRPRPSIGVDVGDGTSVGLEADGGSLIAGGVVSVVGGVSGVLGGRLLSDLGGDPRHAPGRRRGLSIASGVSFGVASGLFVAGVVDLARGGALWNDVLAREFSADDAADGEQAGRRMTRGLAMLTAALPMAGLGLGLSLGPDARARVVASRSGVAVVGQF